jgi:hypothetical protein
MRVLFFFEDFSTGHTVYAASQLVSTAIGFDERMLLHSEASYELVISVNLS